MGLVRIRENVEKRSRFLSVAPRSLGTTILVGVA